MFEISEVKDAKEIARVAGIFKIDGVANNRIFALYEQGETLGVTVIGLSGGAVEIKLVSCLIAAYKDALTRAALNVVRSFSPIRVIVKGDEQYYKQFGFERAGEYMQIMSDKIKFTCNMQ